MKSFAYFFCFITAMGILSMFSIKAIGIIGIFSSKVGNVDKGALSNTIDEFNEDVAIPIHIDLTFSNLPSLGQTAELVADIISVRDAPNTTVNIILPEGFELIRGNLSWKGSLAKNQSLQLKTMIKAVKNGEWVIEGSVKSVVSEDSWWMDKDTIYVSPGNQKISSSSLEGNKLQNNNQTLLSLNLNISKISSSNSAPSSSSSAPSS